MSRHQHMNGFLSVAFLLAIGLLPSSCLVGTEPNEPPTASISSPTDTQVFEVGAPVGFEGSASDLEDDALAGASLVWTSDVDGQIGTGTAFTTNGLSVGAHEITLTATDSDGVTGTASVSITVIETAPNEPPAASITAPTDTQVFEDGATVGFEGSASDPEDGALAGASLVWTSDVDAQIGTGTAFTTNGLSVGAHEITLTATDSEGVTGTASVSITVNGVPTASISSPADDAVFLDTEAITFDGTGTDAEDGALTGASLVWSSSLDGEIGTGAQFTKDAFSLAVGTHTITLNATDDDGATATASVSITVDQDLALGSISGRVFRSQDDAPFAGIRVVRSGPDGETEVVTNAFGGYEFSDVPGGTHDVSVVSEDLPPFGSFVVAGEQQVTITGGLVVGDVDFAFRAAEVEVRTIASLSTADVGAEVAITVELDVSDLPLPLSGISGTIEWPTAVAALVPSSITVGDVWNQTGGGFLTNESPPGTLLFVGVSAITGIADGVFTVMTFRVTTVAADSADFAPDLAELEVFDPATGVSTKVLDAVFLRTTTATVTVQ